MDNVHHVLGIHRNTVKLVEFPDLSYVVKELPDDLVDREYRFLGEIADAGLPTVDRVAAVTERGDGRHGLVITRHLDYSLPYRTLLMGRGLAIPYLGEKLLDALVVLLVRIHLAGFFWGDCSLSNTLFRRDAGALRAFIIDVETAEHHDHLSEGQRAYDLSLATDNVAGGLLDLQAGGQLAPDIDPIEVALQISDRYGALWNEITAPGDATTDTPAAMRDRLNRLQEAGFDVDEIEVVTGPGESGERVTFVPRVVEHGYHAERLADLTGLDAGENQARRLLQDITEYQAQLTAETGAPVRFNIAAVRWLDRVFEPTIAAIPTELLDRLEAAEIFHQILEHRWYESERTGRALSIDDILDDYLKLLQEAPPERLAMDEVDTDDL